MCPNKLSIMTLFFLVHLAANADEGMRAMKVLQPLKTQTVTQDMDLESTRGFGDSEGEARMMSLMMVEGSGYEGMDMSSVAQGADHASHSIQVAMNEPDKKKAASSLSYEFSPNPPVARKTVTLKLTFRDLPKEPHLKYEMETMDMGVDEAKVKKESGAFAASLKFSMSGPWKISVYDKDKLIEAISVVVK